MRFLKILGIIVLLHLVGVIVWQVIWYHNRYHNYAPAVEEAIRNKDFKTAHAKLDKQYATLQKRNGKRENAKTFEEEYEPIAQQLFDAELNFLTSNSKAVNENKVLALVQGIRLYGTPMQGVTDSKKVIASNDSYIQSISRYNYALDKILSKAVALKNKSLAEKVLPLYKPNLLKTTVKTHAFGSDEYSYEYTDEAQQKAEKKYQREFLAGKKAAVAQQEEIKPAEQPKQAIPDVDTNIPLSTTDNSKTFVVIYANEDYKRVGSVPYAKRDGKIFAQYCAKTLGIPKKNIHVVENATLNDMFSEIDWLGQICEAFDGDAKVIVYYSGHGIPDEADKSSYILPVDGDGKRISSGYKLDEFYKDLGQLRAKMVCVFMDACFSGMRKDGEALNPARGVALRVRSGVPQGNMVVFSAAQGDETAYPYNEQQHGMLTYYLLKKLQETKGDVTLQDLGSYLTDHVRRQSLIENNKLQTPCVIPSSTASDWQNWKLK